MPFSRLFGKKEKNQMDDIVEEGVQRVQELPMDKFSEPIPTTDSIRSR